MTAKLENLEAAAKFEKNNQWRELLNFSEQWLIDEPETVFAWQAKGDALRKLGRSAEAIPIFRRGIELAPPYPVDFMGGVMSAAPLWYRLAHAYGESGKIELSIQAFEEAARIDPMAADIWNDLGVAYINSNNYKAALEALKKAVAIDSRNINSIKNLGLIYATCGVEQGVIQAHKMLLGLSATAANDFLRQAQDLLSNH